MVMDYPLMFAFRDAVSGQGFLAGVTITGRALMVQENDGTWWIYGVRPGAIAEGGKTTEDAYLKFRNTYKAVLFDLAAEAADYETFRREVEAFFYQSDIQEERRWEDAFRGLKTGEIKPEGPLSDLPRQDPQTRPAQISVIRLDDQQQRYVPSDNVPDTYFLSNAAA